MDRSVPGLSTTSKNFLNTASFERLSRRGTVLEMLIKGFYIMDFHGTNFRKIQCIIC